MTVVGLLHPGEMGAAVGAALVRAGTKVVWVPAGRSTDTTRRADQAGLFPVSDLDELVAVSDVVVSICPPHGAAEVAESVGGVAAHGRTWWYVDANAVAPRTSADMAATVEAAGGRYVDGGIIGPPPVRSGTTRLYLSGAGAVAVSELLGTPPVEIHVISDRVGDASALKLAYAAWTKGSAALLLASHSAAVATGVDEALMLEWRTSVPDLVDRLDSARRSAEAKGWRWAGEMDEIASMFEASGLPPGFHRAAAEIYRRGGATTEGDGPT